MPALSPIVWSEHLSAVEKMDYDRIRAGFCRDRVYWVKVADNGYTFRWSSNSLYFPDHDVERYIVRPFDVRQPANSTLLASFEATESLQTEHGLVAAHFVTILEGTGADGRPMLSIQIAFPFHQQDQPACIGTHVTYGVVQNASVLHANASDLHANASDQAMAPGTDSPAEFSDYYYFLRLGDNLMTAWNTKNQTLFLGQFAADAKVHLYNDCLSGGKLETYNGTAEIRGLWDALFADDLDAKRWRGYEPFRATDAVQNVVTLHVTFGPGVHLMGLVFGTCVSDCSDPASVVMLIQRMYVIWSANIGVSDQAGTCGQ